MAQSHIMRSEIDYGYDVTASSEGDGDGDMVDSPNQSRTPSRHPGPRALATVYDAVAGRVTYDRVIRHEGRDQRRTGVSQQQQEQDQQRLVRDTFKLGPEDVLFRRKDAPERYEEHDIYRANEWELPPNNRGDSGILPASDLLKAIHEYSSRFYGVQNRSDQQQRFRDGRHVDECSMDETALLAFGILLEEAGREVLGRRGHLVFTEALEDTEGHNEAGPLKDFHDVIVGHRHADSPQTRQKRRKLATSEELSQRSEN